MASDSWNTTRVYAAESLTSRRGYQPTADASGNIFYHRSYFCIINHTTGRLYSIQRHSADQNHNQTKLHRMTVTVWQPSVARERLPLDKMAQVGRHHFVLQTPTTGYLNSHLHPLPSQHPPPRHLTPRFSHSFASSSHPFLPLSHLLHLFPITTPTIATS
jgi:hypothetical protein